MSARDGSIAASAESEVSALIATLHATGQRLEELTAGEVDSVADRDGRTFLLRPAQEQLRHQEAARQSGILNALPACIALLDRDGVIMSVNDAWRGFSCPQVTHGPGHPVGGNMLEICDAARGDGSGDAHSVAEGVRSVLGGWEKTYSIEYACHAGDKERWLMLVATPLAGDAGNGAVLMHLDVTRERHAKEGLAESESRFRQLAEGLRDVFFLRTMEGSQMLYVSPSYEQIWGQTCESLYANPSSWAQSIHPDDVQQTLKKYSEGRTTGFDFEYRIVRPDGELRWIHVRGYPVLDAGGKPYRIAGSASDITHRKQEAEELHRNRSLKGAILESSLDCVVTIDNEGRIVEFNPAAERTFGVTRAQALGRIMVDFMVPERLRAAHNAGFAKYLRTGESAILGKRVELEALRADGTEFPIELAISKVRSAYTPMFTAFIRDISERKAAEHKIKRLNRVYAVLSGINTLIVRVRDRDELFKAACRIAVEQGGFHTAWIGVVDRAGMKVVPVTVSGAESAIVARSKEGFSLREGDAWGLSARAVREKKAMVANAIGDDPRLLLASEHLEHGVASMAVLPLLVGDEAVGTLALYSGEQGFFDDAEMRLLQELAGDISFAIDHIGKQELLDYIAYYDSLTGLANRGLFLDRVAQHMRTASGAGHGLAVFLVDLERFKNINDSLGQPAGDELLRQVATWLSHDAGDASLLARVDADHFAVVLPVIQPGGDVSRVIEKSMAAFLDHPFRLNDAVFRVSAKVGAAVFPGDGTTADALFKNAEAALKRAKAQGNRYLVYNQTMTAAVAGKLTLENQLRRALDEEQFVLHYQPKVSLATGKLTGAEALIRWNDPKGGLVAPGRFIPILEETGLILEVGRWALRKAIEDYLRWRAAGLPAVRVAVNVSPLQLRDRGFIADIGGVIGEAAGGLELEITESLIMEDVKGSIASLQAIRAMGVTVAIDDFGTGFSSLSYLAQLPVDSLKIDRSFVTDMTKTPQGLALVSTIINLAHSLKLGVVAEGVETDEQSRLLRLLNCDEMQGFLFAKPVAAAEFEGRFLTP